MLSCSPRPNPPKRGRESFIQFSKQKRPPSFFILVRAVVCDGTRLTPPGGAPRRARLYLYGLCLLAGPHRPLVSDSTNVILSQPLPAQSACKAGMRARPTEPSKRHGRYVLLFCVFCRSFRKSGTPKAAHAGATVTSFSFQNSLSSSMERTILRSYRPRLGFSVDVRMNRELDLIVNASQIVALDNDFHLALCFLFVDGEQEWIRNQRYCKCPRPSTLPLLERRQLPQYRCGKKYRLLAGETSWLVPADASQMLREISPATSQIRACRAVCGLACT